MSSRRPSQVPAARRERRAAQRAASRTLVPSPRRSAGRQSPVLPITIAVLAIGVVVVAFLAMQNPSTGGAGAIQSPTATTPVALAHGRTLGSDAAPVTVEVYSDFQCPICRQFWTTMEPKIVAEDVAGGRAHLVYRDFEFIGAESLAAAIAARCADAQDRFWQYHDILFANQGRENSGAFSDTRLTDMATTVGLDVPKWQTCRADRSIATAIQQETAAGQAKGVNGTPTVAVNGQLLPSYDVATVEGAIASAMGSATPAPVGSSGVSATPGGTPAGS